MIVGEEGFNGKGFDVGEEVLNIKDEALNVGEGLKIDEEVLNVEAKALNSGGGVLTSNHPPSYAVFL